MKRFIEGTDGAQVTLLPESLEDEVGENNAVRYILSPQLNFGPASSATAS